LAPVTNRRSKYHNTDVLYREIYPIFSTPLIRSGTNVYYSLVYIAESHFWATVCKTVHPILSDRCLSVLSCLSVTLVYCGQTVGWIKMPLGMEIGLGPGCIVLDGNPAPSHRKGHSSPSPLFGPRLLWPNGRPSQQLLNSCRFCYTKAVYTEIDRKMQ